MLYFVFLISYWKIFSLWPFRKLHQWRFPGKTSLTKITVIILILIIIIKLILIIIIIFTIDINDCVPDWKGDQLSLNQLLTIYFYFIQNQLKATRLWMKNYSQQWRIFAFNKPTPFLVPRLIYCSKKCFIKVFFSFSSSSSFVCMVHSRLFWWLLGVSPYSARQV